MNPSYWQGEKVRLRSIETEDWRHFLKFEEDVIYNRFTYFVDFPSSPEGLKDWTQKLATAPTQNDEYRWVIETLDGTFVGTINIHTIDSRSGTFQYGIAILSEHWRKGYAAEAVRMVLRYFFDEKRYQKANVHIYAINPGSVTFHEQLGFQHEGCLRRMGYTAGEYFDHILMGITREEFKERVEH